MMRSVVCWVVLAGPGTLAAHIIDCDEPTKLDECVRAALMLDGAVSVHTPGLKAARTEALRSFARCATSDSSALETAVLPDGTLRRSLGTRTLEGLAEPLAVPGCEDLAEATAALRALVDGAAMSLLRILQPLQSGPTALLALKRRTYATLTDAARAGEQLEHFHLYEPPRAMPRSQRAKAIGEARLADARVSMTNSTSDHTRRSDAGRAGPSTSAVPLHTDAGLFVAIVPSMWIAPSPRRDRPLPPERIASRAVEAQGDPHGGVDGRGGEERPSGFYVQRWDGERARISPGSESSSIVFVIGDGWAQWINPRLSAPLRPAPHAMVMPRMHAMEAEARGEGKPRTGDGAADASPEGESSLP